jgi:uncharacterized protein (TIGR02301 family)
MHQDRLLHRARLHPSTTLPVKGRVPVWWRWQVRAPDTMRHLPLDGRGWEGAPGRSRSKARLAAILCSFALLLATPSFAVDPLYQRQMERLSEIMGSLYFLQPLCNAGDEDWRAQAAELIALDEPDEDRRQRLAGAFNTGYTAFSRFHRHCTPSSQEALARLLTEAQRLARDIHTRFAE